MARTKLTVKWRVETGATGSSGSTTAKLTTATRPIQQTKPKMVAGKKALKIDEKCNKKVQARHRSSKRNKKITKTHQTLDP